MGMSEDFEHAVSMKSCNKTVTLHYSNLVLEKILNVSYHYLLFLFRLNLAVMLSELDVLYLVSEI